MLSAVCLSILADTPLGPIAFEISKEVRRLNTSGSVHSRSGSMCIYIVVVLGIEIISSCDRGEADLLKLLQKVLLSSIALASCAVAITSLDLSVGISEVLCVTLLMAFQTSFLPGFKFLKKFFLELLIRDTVFSRY